MRLIDADALAFTHDYVTADGEPCITKAVIDNAPAIDAVPVVRCIDCKWRNTIGCDSYVASLDRHCCEDDDFCKWGERKDDE